MIRKKWRRKMTDKEMQFWEIRLGYFRARKKCVKKNQWETVLFLADGITIEMCSCVCVCSLTFVLRNFYLFSLPFHQLFLFSLFSSCLFFSHLSPLPLFFTSLLSPSLFRLELLTDARRVSKKGKIMKCNSMKRMVRRASDIHVVFLFSFRSKKEKLKAKGTKRYRTNGKRDRKRLFLGRKITTTRNLQRRFQCKTLIEKPRQPCCSLFSFTHPTTSHLFSLLK